MDIHRKIITLLLLVLWLPFTAHCTVGECHDLCKTECSQCGHDHHDDHGGHAECEGHHHDLSTVRHSMELPVAWAFVAVLVENGAGSPPVDLPGIAAFNFSHGPPGPPPLHLLVLRTAQPVRGPSFAA